MSSSNASPWFYRTLLVRMLTIIIAMCCSVVVTEGFVPQSNLVSSKSPGSLYSSTSSLNEHDGSKKSNNGSKEESKPSLTPNDLSRRGLFESISTTSTLAMMTTVMMTMTGNPTPAHSELVQFPCKPGQLKNNYHFMRAGQSLLEAQDIWGTNPMFLTNRENALSDMGRTQVQEACNTLRDADLSLSLVKYAIAANAMDTADLLQQQLQIGRNQLMPEYTYLDQRGIGAYDMQPYHSTLEAIWAMDAQEAGPNGLSGGLPPPNTDGTAAEMLGHQVTRLRQLLSVMETRSGESILLVFPDGTGPSLLSCLIAGIPLNRVHELEFASGEVRMDVTYDSVRSILPTNPNKEYLAALQRGNEQLEVFRNTDVENIVNVRDQQYLAEQQEQERLNEQSKLEARRRQQEAQKERERKYGAAIAGEHRATKEETENGLVAMELAAVAVAAMYTSTAAGNALTEEKHQDELKTATTSMTNQNVANPTALSGTPISPPRSSSSSSNTIDSRNHSELQEMEERIQEAPIKIPEFGASGNVVFDGDEPAFTWNQDGSRSENGGDQFGSSTNQWDNNPFATDAEISSSSENPNINRKELREQMAAKAMENYLNQDDGLEDFLGFMDDLMHEDDFDDVNSINGINGDDQLGTHSSLDYQ